MDERDVVIVGAGPAGASAGFFLKEERPDIDVLMIDRLDEGKYSRYHRMCGEAISRAAFKDLAPLGPTNVVNRITRMREEWPGGRVVEAKAVGYILDRPAFLKGVLDRYRGRGGELIHDAVERVSSVGKGTLLTMTSGRSVLARNLVAADGANSVIRRTLFTEAPPIMIWTEQHIVKRKVREDTITFLQAERYKGFYRWEFPSGENARIGFPRGVDSLAGEEVLETHRRPIPMGGLRTLVKGNVLLTGDAGALTNPLTAGGIRVAMLSGRRAAEAVLWGDPSSYQRWWDRSPFSSGTFMRAFRKLESMSDLEYEEASRGLNANPLSLAWGYLTRPHLREIYGAYGPSGRYGW
ncbi:MAG: NAD(P)/FAD-dependent oxidoreductase [Methanomassiliicoccus sp.]|nr:NAD(P)/FAD-dependent oxidoreductase [Methanomassiliicoccus sp.]